MNAETSEELASSLPSRTWITMDCLRAAHSGQHGTTTPSWPEQSTRTCAVGSTIPRTAEISYGVCCRLCLCAFPKSPISSIRPSSRLLHGFLEETSSPSDSHEFSDRGHLTRTRENKKGNEEKQKQNTRNNTGPNCIASTVVGDVETGNKKIHTGHENRLHT